MRRDVEFDAEGVTLRGWHYVPDGAGGPVPTIVMAHGFSATKEMYLDRFAEAFAANGFAALVFDNRNFGASDGEPDDQYKARSRGFYRAARRGTMDAIVFGLQSTDGVALGSALEVLDPTTFLPASRVRCFAQDQIGRGNDGLAARAQVALLGYRAAGVPAIVEASTPVSTTVRIRGLLLDSRFAMDTDERVEAVRAAVVATGNGQVAGAALLRSTLIAAIKSVQGVIFEDTMLIEPAASVQPSSIYEVIRVDASDVIFEP